MFYEPGHPITTETDWKSFQKSFSPYLFEKVVDRSALDLPDWFMPLARGAAIPSEQVLKKIGCRPGSRRPAYWTKIGKDEFRTNVGGSFGFGVRKIGDFWAAFYLRLGQLDEVLVFHFGSTPVVTRTYEAAMRLVRHYIRNGSDALGYRWITVRPVDCDGAIAIAQKLRGDLAAIAEIKLDRNRPGDHNACAT